MKKIFILKLLVNIDKINKYNYSVFLFYYVHYAYSLYKNDGNYILLPSFLADQSTKV